MKNDIFSFKLEASTVKKNKLSSLTFLSSDVFRATRNPVKAGKISNLNNT